MLDLLRKIYYFFSPYAHPFERRAEKFFQWVNSSRSSHEVHKRLLELMQENLLVLNVWLEKRFKNYRYLTKWKRREMYKNAKLIAEDFGNRAHGREKDYLQALCRYFNPQGRFQYEESSSFGKLLVNPSKERMVGDCNQIVTMYAWLFSLAFPIQELQIKLIPGHVCLHYKGDDIEATSGTFKKYEKFDYVAPITELISTNLLDINDPTAAAASISAETFVKASQLAYAISNKREVVMHNLSVAYRDLCLASLHQKNLEKARFYAEKSGKRGLLRACDQYELSVLFEKIRHVKTIKEARNFRSIYEKLAVIAHRLGDSKFEGQMREILRKL